MNNTNDSFKKTRKNSVLVVDDENNNIIALTNILKHEYIVYAAKNGQGAIEVAEKHLPDIILLDIIMPDMDGYSVIVELRNSEKTKNIPIILITGLSSPQDEEKGLAFGVADYITKPFSPAIVKLRVGNQMKLIEQFRSNQYDIMKYKLANDALKIALWDFDINSGDLQNPENAKFYWSQEFREVLGFSDENDFPNSSVSLVKQIHPEDRESVNAAFIAHLSDLTGKTPYDIEYRLQLKNGEYRSFHAFGTAQRDNTGVPLRMAGAIMDITEKKQMEEKDRKTKVAEESNRAKSQFLANMSHEMRTPLNVIVGLTGLMLEEEDPTVNLNENLIKISTAGNTLLGLINNVLDISKIEAGRLELMPVQYDIPSLINDITILNVIRFEDKPITFVLDIDENLPLNLFGDDLRVKQIINNILSNAFKYTQKGTVTLSINCKKDDTITDGNEMRLFISVSDTGIGIRQEDLSMLFIDYGQVDTRTNRAIEGTGLGLAITKRLTEMMNGEISVESEYGVGSTFHLRLNQGFVNDKTIGKETAERLCSFRYSQGKNNDGKKLIRSDLGFARVLVVDDMQTNLDVAAGLLGKYKMQVDCVLNGHEAIERITKGMQEPPAAPIYNAIFMDHMMPEMDGIETVKKIRALGSEYARTIPVIALTANAIQGTENLFLANDFQAFIPKPIDIMQLDAIVRNWVKRVAENT